MAYISYCDGSRNGPRYEYTTSWCYQLGTWYLLLTVSGNINQLIPSLCLLPPSNTPSFILTHTPYRPKFLDVSLEHTFYNLTTSTYLLLNYPQCPLTVPL